MSNSLWAQLMFVSSVEKNEVALTKMLTTVLKDKEKIEKTIEELDRYKRDALGNGQWVRLYPFVIDSLPTGAISAAFLLNIYLATSRSCSLQMSKISCKI